MSGKEYIEKGALLAEFHSLCGPQTGDGWDNWGVQALIERQAVVPVTPIVRGEWKESILACEAWADCPVCGEYVRLTFDGITLFDTPGEIPNFCLNALLK